MTRRAKIDYGYGSTVTTYPHAPTGSVALGQSGALSGDSDTAASFNGSTSSISVPSSPSLNITSQLTLECWINYSMPNGGTGAPGIITKDDGYIVRGYGLYAAYAANQHLEFALNVAGAQKVLTTSGSYNDAHWHYVVATYDGSTMRIYVDGSLVASTAASGAIETNSDPLMIGSFDQANADSHFQGSIDEAAVYSYALSAGQIADHYAAAAGTMERPRWQYTYDHDGNQLTQVDPQGNVTSFTYDALGRELSRTLPDGQTGGSNAGHETETFTYDQYGNQRTHVDFNGNTAVNSYYTTGVHAGLIQEADYYKYPNTPLSLSPDETVTYGYDSLNRQATVNDSANGTITYNYDEAGGNVIIDPTTGAMTPVAGDFGSLTSVVTPQGTIHYIYDVVTGLLAETWTGTGPNDSTSTTETLYGHDQQGRLASVTTAREDGAVVSLTSSVNTREDAKGNAIPTTLPTALYLYDGLGNLVRQINPNNTETDYDYSNYWNPAGGEEIVTNKRTSDGTILSKFTYTFNAQRQKISELDQMSDAGESVSNTQLYTWAYDADGRLTDETFDNQSDGSGGTNAVTTDDFHDHYDYDLNGNRVDEKIDTSDDGGTGPSAVYDQVTNYSYNGDNQLKTEAQTTVATGTTVYQTVYTYDNNGSLLTSTRTGTNPGVTTYTYDARNRILTVTSGGSTTTYTYDDDGMLVQQTNADGNTTIYLIDANNPTGYSQVLEVRKNGNIATTYALGKSIIAQDVGGTTSYIMADGHGSTRQLTAYTGDSGDSRVVARYDYDGFGNLITLSASTHSPNTIDTPILYVGMLLDSITGNYRTESREYMAADGRFFGRDQYIGRPGDFLNADLYAYTANNPTNAADPTGKFGFVGLLATGAAIGAGIGALSSYAATGSASLGQILLGAAIGAAGLPLIIAFPMVGIGLAVAGVAQSWDLMWQVWMNPRSTKGQLAASIVVFGTSAFGVYAATANFTANGWYNTTAFGSPRKPLIVV